MLQTVALTLCKKKNIESCGNDHCDMYYLKCCDSGWFELDALVMHHLDWQRINLQSDSDGGCSSEFPQRQRGTMFKLSSSESDQGGSSTQAGRLWRSEHGMIINNHGNTKKGSSGWRPTLAQAGLVLRHSHCVPRPGARICNACRRAALSSSPSPGTVLQYSVEAAGRYLVAGTRIA